MENSQSKSVLESLEQGLVKLSAEVMCKYLESLNLLSRIYLDRKYGEHLVKTYERNK